MKPINYMTRSLDFCLYPNEIVQRFGGKEVIVYSTDWESYGFVRTFVQYLRITSVFNNFASEVPSHEDMERVLTVRRREPVFVLSQRYWLEIVSYLESKGLVLGADIFLLEQGYPMDETVARFVKHNELIWKSSARRSKNVVLFPYQSNYHDAAVSVFHAYCTNYLAQLHDAEIHAYTYLHITRERDLMCFNRSLRDVTRAFNVTGVVDFSCSEEQLRKAQMLFNQIWNSVNTWRELEQLTINGMVFGTSIIRDFMRFYVPSLNLKSQSFAQYLYFITQRIVAIMDYFQTNRNVKAVVVWDGVGRDSFLRDIAISHGIPTYGVHCQDLAAKFSLNYSLGHHFQYYREFFRQLSPREQEVGLEFAKRSLDARLHGDTKDLPMLDNSVYSSKARERVLAQNDKLKLLICPHTMEDDLYVYDGQIFSGMIDWLDHLGQLSEKTEYDWYLKMHPVAGKRDEAFYREFFQRYPRIKLIPAWTSPQQLRDEGVKFAFTLYGTIGHEYPAIGIQVINAANNRHVAFDFCYNPKTVEEFDRLVFDLPNRVDLPIDMNEIYQFYCVHYLYYKEHRHELKGVLLRRPELYGPTWAPKVGTIVSLADRVKRYDWYLEDWTSDLHELSKTKIAELFAELDSRRDDDFFYKNDRAVIDKKLSAVGLSLD